VETFSKVAAKGNPPSRAVAQLVSDHSQIETMCSVLEAAAARMEHGDYVDPRMIVGLLRFFDEFADRSHQRKEEQALFPPLRASGERACALADRLSQEHSQRRDLLDELARSFRHLRSDPSAALDLFLAAARRYADSMRDHLRLENESFQECADGLVSVAQDDDLCRRFGEIERHALGPTGREWYNQVVSDYRDIVAVWGTPFDHPPRSRTR
jgi:hemerythrin-like domain-containing protein